MGASSWLDRWAQRNQGGYDVREVFGPRGKYVLRLEPVGTPSVFGHLFEWVVIVAGLLRLVSRERRWVVVVRRREDDPDGPVVHEETFDSREAARPRLDALERQYRGAG